jgi:hypothetical protein
MQPKFELGKVVVKEEADYALVWVGQDAAFFLAKRAAGDGWKGWHFPLCRPPRSSE